MNQCLPIRLTTARYNDVLALSEDPRECYLTGSPCSLEHLGKLGFEVTAGKQEHWIVTRAGEPLEIHLYSAAELAHFAARHTLIHKLTHHRPVGTTNNLLLESEYEQYHPDHSDPVSGGRVYRSAFWR